MNRTLTQHQILHILRNPYGKTEEEKRVARLEAADEIERLQRNLTAAPPTPKAARFHLNCPTCRCPEPK